MTAHDCVTLRTSARDGDSRAVRDIVASTGFFSPAEINVAVELIDDRLKRGDESDYHFIFADCDDETIGYACFGEIACTVGSYDLYWIAVHERHRGAGLGTRLLQEAERIIASRDGRRIYIETSSRPQYDSTQQFYVRCGYRVEATLADFYAPGDGKIVLCKPI